MWKKEECYRNFMVRLSFKVIGHGKVCGKNENFKY